MSLRVERGRTRARSQAMQLLFQAEALDVPLEDVLSGDYLLSKGPLDDFAVELAEGCYAHLDEVDAVLGRVSDNWRLDRMPGTDRNLMRIAVYEMRYAPERLTDAIVINEAVEIAKAYGTDESSRFVNGVLGRVSRLDASVFDAEPDQAAEAAPIASEAPATGDEA